MLCFRGEREAWIKGKYSQHKFVSLEIFLTKCQKLDKGIIKNLARMKVYHEEKGIERTDSKKSKILRRKLALKGHKSKADKRKSAPSVLLSDLTTKDYENLEKMASSLLEQSNDEVSNCSSDSHDDERPEVVSPDDASRPRASSVSGTRSLSFEDGRDRGDSVDSNLSDDGLVASDNGEVEADEEKSLKEDKVKAIAVLKRIHPSRVGIKVFNKFISNVILSFISESTSRQDKANCDSVLIGSQSGRDEPILSFALPMMVMQVKVLILASHLDLMLGQ